MLLRSKYAPNFNMVPIRVSYTNLNTQSRFYRSVDKWHTIETQLVCVEFVNKHMHT